MILAFVLLLVLVFMICAFVYRATLQHRLLQKANRLASGGGLSSVETVTLGGVSQTILLQAADPTKPVLLVLHGGPSMPLPGVCCRAQDYVANLCVEELIQHYVVVFWDQRGTGRSYHTDIPESSIHLDTFVSDARELSDYLRDRFQQPKIHLAAISWGTLIGLSLVSKFPEKYSTYTGIAQIADWSKSDALTYDWLFEEAHQRGQQKAIRELTAVGRPPYVENMAHWSTPRKWSMKLGGLVYVNKKENIRNAGLLWGFKTMLTSPDFTLRDVMNTMVRGMKLAYNPRMLQDFNQTDFFATAPQVHVPVHFFHGTHDHHVPGSVTYDYYETLHAPQGKSFTWLERSAHIFHPEDARVVEEHLIRQLKKKVQDAS